MPKLYYTPTSCSSSLFITAYIHGVSLEADQVDLYSNPRMTQSGVEYLTINPKGSVPALILEDGTNLNETAAAIQYIADQKAGPLLPTFGTVDRYRVMNSLNFVSTEIHPTIAAGVFYVATEPEARAAQLTKMRSKLQLLETAVAGGKTTITGLSGPTVADIYCAVVLAWAFYKPESKAIMEEYPGVLAYIGAINAHPGVVAARERMGTKPTTTI